VAGCSSVRRSWGVSGRMSMVPAAVQGKRAQARWAWALLGTPSTHRIMPRLRCPAEVAKPGTPPGPWRHMSFGDSEQVVPPVPLCFRHPKPTSKPSYGDLEWCVHDRATIGVRVERQGLPARRCGLEGELYGGIQATGL
jgi:hypothetical protein